MRNEDLETKNYLANQNKIIVKLKNLREAIQNQIEIEYQQSHNNSFPFSKGKSPQKRHSPRKSKTCRNNRYFNARIDPPLYSVISSPQSTSYQNNQELINRTIPKSRKIPPTERLSPKEQKRTIIAHISSAISPLPKQKKKFNLTPEPKYKRKSKTKMMQVTPNDFDFEKDSNVNLVENENRLLYFKHFQLKSFYFACWQTRCLENDIENVSNKISLYKEMLTKPKIKKTPQEKASHEIQRIKSQSKNNEVVLNSTKFAEISTDSTLDEYPNDSDPIYSEFESPPIYDSSNNTNEGLPYAITKHLPSYQLPNANMNEEDDPPLFFEDSSERERFITMLNESNEKDNDQNPNILIENQSNSSQKNDSIVSLSSQSKKNSSSSKSEMLIRLPSSFDENIINESNNTVSASVLSMNFHESETEMQDNYYKNDDDETNNANVDTAANENSISNNDENDTMHDESVNPVNISNEMIMHAKIESQNHVHNQEVNYQKDLNNQFSTKNPDKTSQSSISSVHVNPSVNQQNSENESNDVLFLIEDNQEINKDEASSEIQFLIEENASNIDENKVLIDEEEEECSDNDMNVDQSIDFNSINPSKRLIHNSERPIFRSIEDEKGYTESLNRSQVKPLSKEEARKFFGRFVDFDDSYDLSSDTPNFLFENDSSEERGNHILRVSLDNSNQQSSSDDTILIKLVDPENDA